MSLIARKRAWASSQRRTKKLLLIALAEYADDQGFCWVGAPTLAERLGEEIDYTQRLLGELIDSGDLLRKRRVGRGNCSIYCVVSTLDEHKRAELALELSHSVIRGNKREIVNTALESSVFDNDASDDEQTLDDSADEQNTALESSVLSINTALENTVLENSVFSSAKHCTGVMSNERSPSASPSAKTTQKSTEIDHDSIDDDDDARARAKTNRRQHAIPPHVAYLSEQGMGAAHLFADCDPDATIADFNARIADNWDVAAIVKAWRITPPRRGKVYERRVKTDNSSGSADRGAAASQQSRTTRAARPGEAAYYTSKRSGGSGK